MWPLVTTEGARKHVYCLLYSPLLELFIPRRSSLVGSEVCDHSLGPWFGREAYGLGESSLGYAHPNNHSEIVPGDPKDTPWAREGLDLSISLIIPTIPSSGWATLSSFNTLS